MGRRTMVRLRCVNPVAADVSPLIIPAGGSLSRLTSAATMKLMSIRLSRAVRFPAGANVAQAFGHDAAGMGEISIPIPAHGFSRGYGRCSFSNLTNGQDFWNTFDIRNNFSSDSPSIASWVIAD